MTSGKLVRFLENIFSFPNLCGLREVESCATDIGVAYTNTSSADLPPSRLSGGAFPTLLCRARRNQHRPDKGARPLPHSDAFGERLRAAGHLARQNVAIVH